MDATIRATCPTCQSALKIPAAWAGQAVKCKGCGAVVRTKAPSDVVPPAAVHAAPAHPPAEPSPFDDLAPGGRTTPVPGSFNPFESAPQPAAYEPNGYPAQPYPVAANPYPAAAYPHPAPTAYPQPSAAPAYPQPAAVSAVAAAIGGGFQPSEATQAKTGGKRKYQRGGGAGKYVWLGVAVVLTAGMVGGAVVAVPWIKAKLAAGPVEGGNPPVELKGGGTAANPNRSALVGGGVFPRRLLFVHISNYLYLNPLTANTQIGTSVGADKTRAAALRLAYEWRVPVEKDNNQVFVLSDTAPPPDNRTPFKNVLTGTYEKFFDTSRTQDRIVVYFGGHVVTRKADDKMVTYLVPVEGDPDDDASLVPLADFYAKLKECKATQKVVIWDVCRFNPQRGRQRPGSEPMTAETAAALAAAPEGVQVVTTCQGGENALEFNALQVDGKNDFVGGSNFLEAGKYVNDKQKGGAKALGPNDPLPIDAWITAVAKRAGDIAEQAPDKVKQTVKAAGNAPESLVAYKADEPPAERFAFPVPPKGAPEAEVKGVETELALPSIKSDGNDLAIGSLPYPADTFVAYKADVPLDEIMRPENAEKYRFRVNVVKAYETIRGIWGENGGKLRGEFTDKSSDAVKKKILEEQLFPAKAIPLLDRAISNLEAVEPTKAEQPKRWQAHFDYALAQCKARLAFMHEYDLALGSIRTDVLPALDPKKGEDGYRLISAEKMRIKTEKKSADEAKEIFEKLIEDHKGTPWAILAKRDKSMILGLAWQPFSSTAAQEEAAEMKDKK